MNSFKKTQSNWILCPSKSIPGKFYYFNVVTGEAVWGLDDIQINTLKKDNNITKLTDKSHTYPEPQMHNMTEEFPNTSNIYSNMGNLYQQIPTTTYPRYGQAVFPQYIPSVTPSLVPSIIWTPIQMPMLMTNEKKLLDRNTQTGEIVSNLKIQTCKMPLSKRFALLGNSKKFSIFGSSNENIVGSSLMCTENKWNRQYLFNNNGQINDQMQQNSKKLDKSIIIREPKLKFEKPALENTVSNENIKQCKGKSSQHTINHDEENEKNQDGLLKKLDKNDLRYLLISKRKSADLGVLNDDKNEDQASNDSHTVLPEKKVLFNVNTTSDNESIISLLDGDVTPKPIPIKLLRDLGKIIDPNTFWYIVVDRDILLDNIDFIMEYIDGDEFCKLLVPISVLKNIQTLGIGDGKYPIVLNARQIYRRLINTSDKVHTVELKKATSMYDDVLNCCLQAIEENLHVVLITINTEVYEKALTLGIRTYFLDDIKTENPKPKSPTFDFQPIKVTVENKDLFPQRAKFVTSKSHNLSNEKHNDNDNTIDMIAINKNILELNLNSSKDTKRVIKNDKNDNKKIDTATDNNKNEYINATNTEEVMNGSSSDLNKAKSFKPLVFQKVFFKQNGLINKNLVNIGKTIENKKEQDSFKNDAINPETLKNKENGGFCDWKSNFLSTDNESNDRNATDNKCHIENKIKRFYIKDKVTEQNIIARMEEYSCCYIQIMEEFLNIVLRKNIFVQKCLPCSFLEGLEYLKEFYFDIKIKKIIEELMSLWKKDNMKTDVKPSDFIRVIGRGWMLVDSLKNNIPHEIKEIEFMFTKLVENIENPIIEDVELIQTPKRRSQDQIIRSNFIKEKCEIIEYLKNNFVEWKDFEISKSNTIVENIRYNDDVNIIRTSGKHLNRFKIDNKKQITLNSHSDDENNKNVQKPQTNGQTHLNIPILHENTFGTKKDGPKVIRNVKPIDEFEEKMKIINSQLNFNDRYSDDTFSCTIENNDMPNNDINYINKLNDNYNLKNDKFVNDYQNNDHYSLTEANNDTIDNGFENDSLYTCTFIRNFLVDLSTSFKLIYTFIDKCHHEFSDGVMEEKEKNILYEKAKQTHIEICAIIDKLKSIIERESAESTKLKLLLTKAGLDVYEDKRIARYRQTVTKCLEQAQILNCCLKLILSTNKNDVIDNISFKSYNLLSYFNLFE